MTHYAFDVDVINPSRPIDLDNPQVKCVYACLMEKARMVVYKKVLFKNLYKNNLTICR